jgi:multiple sugar transport system ATP-binding protein
MTLADRVAVLDRGVLQQADRPLILYDKPCNRFVAGFLGRPAMNFASGQLQAKSGKLVFTVEDSGICLPVPATRIGEWSAFRDRPLTLGIRPEDIRLTESGVAADLAMKVASVEPLGHAILATLEREGWQATARLAARNAVGERLRLEIQQLVEINIQMEHAHLFDRISGMALRSPGTATVPTG